MAKKTEKDIKEEESMKEQMAYQNALWRAQAKGGKAKKNAETWQDRRNGDQWDQNKGGKAKYGPGYAKGGKVTAKKKPAKKGKK